MNQNNQSGLYNLVLQRISHLDISKDGIVRFPTLFEKLCVSLQISKKQAWDILFIMKDLGFIEIIPYQGVKITNLVEL